jgi:hypothetical protein
LLLRLRLEVKLCIGNDPETKKEFIL